VVYRIAARFPGFLCSLCRVLYQLKEIKSYFSFQIKNEKNII